MKTPRNIPPVFHLRPVAAALLFALAAPAGAQLPSGANVVAGQASISQSATQQVITQTTDKAIINWNSFSIGSGQGVTFIQPGSGSVALNRVVGSDPSSIFGSLSANGQIFLVNPNGVFFGRGAVLDTAGLVATTLDIRNDDFLAGRYTFSRAANAQDGASIINEGLLRARDGGYVLLAGDRAENRAGGVIEARLGTVALAAGGRLTLDIQGDKLVNFTVDETTANRLGGVSNLGQIAADGGRVVMSARVAREAVSAVVNAGGSIRAAGIEEKDGEILLTGGEGEVRVSGNLDVTGQWGGRIQVSGERVGLLAGATLDASGRKGGGTVLVGGDAHGSNAAVPNAKLTTVAVGASLKADALDTGNGGKVVVWSDDTTRFVGQISARGGANGGNGGFVEVSGKRNLGFDGNVDTSAPRGKSGTLLLDPATITITDGASGTGAEDTQVDADQPTAGNPVGEVVATDGGAVGFTISRGKLESLNATTNIVLEATGQITINDMASNLINLQTGAGNSFTLKSTATGGITFLDSNDEIRTNGGAINLLALGGGGASGTITNLGKLTSNGGAIAVYSGTDGLIVGKAINAGTGTVSLQADELTGGTQTLAINAAVTGGTVKLDAADGITQGAGGAIIANNLVVRYAAGPNPDSVDLSQANQVDRISAAVTGSGTGATNAFSFRNAAGTALQVTTIDGLTGIDSKGGAISLAADSLDIAQQLKADGDANGSVHLATSAANRDIRLGSENGSAALILTQTELDRIKTGASGLLRIGTTANTGNITLASNIVSSATTWSSLSLKTGGTVTQSAGALTVAKLAVEALGAGAMSLTNNSTAAGTVALKSNGALTYSYGSGALADLTIGTVDGLSGIASQNGNISLTSAHGLNLTQDVNAGTGTIALSATGVNQSAGALTATGLKLSGSGSFNLDQATNSVGTVAANVSGGVSLTNTGLLTVGSVGGTNGVTTGGASVTLTADRMAITQDITTAGGGITLKPLTAAQKINLGAATDGNADTLELSTSEIARLKSSAGGLTFGNTAINGQITVSAPISVTSPLSLENGTGGIQINSTLATSAGGGITLNSGGAISDNAGVTGISASTLNATAVGGISLSGTGNAVSTLYLANTVSGDITVTNNKAALALNSVSQAGGGAVSVSNTGTLAINAAPISTDGGDLSLSSGGAMTLLQDLSAPGATISLHAASGGVTQTAGVVTASALKLTGVGVFNLANYKTSVAGATTTYLYNNVATLAADITGALTYWDKDALTVGSVGGVNGIATHGGALSLTTGGTNTTGGGPTTYNAGNLTLAQSMNSGAGTMTLKADSTGALSQTGGSLSAGALTVTSGGAATLNQAGNDVSSVSISASGAVAFQDANTVTVGGTGISSGNANIDISTGGLLTLAKEINAGTGTVTIASGGGIVQSGGGVVGNALRLSGTGNFILNQVSTDPSSGGSNNVVTLAADVTGTLNYLDANALAIGTVGGISGVTSSGGGDIDVRTHSGSLTVSQEVASAGAGAGRGDVSLIAGGSGSHLAVNHNVRGDQVRLNSEGTMSQSAPGCGAPPCPAVTSYVEAQNLYLGSQNNPDTAIWNRSAAPLAEIVRYFTGDTTLSENLNASKLIIWGVDGASSFRLGAGFGITSSSLLLGGKGSFYLDNAGNDITTLAVARPWGSNSGYNVRYADADTFTLGTVTWNALLSSSSSVGTWTWGGNKTFSGVNNNGMWGSAWWEFGGTGGEVKLTAGGAGTIVLAKSIATGGQVLLNSPGGLTEAAGATISGSNLKVVANGAVNLGNTNSVTGFAAQVTNASNVTLVTSQDLSIGTVDGISGVTLTNNGEATVDIRSTAGAISVSQPISVVTNGGAANNTAPAHIKLRSYRNLNIASSLTARGGTAGTGVGAEVVLRADRGGVFHTGGSINAYDDGPVTAAAQAPHQGKITVRAGADYLDAGSDIWNCAWNFSDCGKVTLSTLAASSTNGSAIIDVFAPNGLTGNGTITATGQTAPRIRLTGDIQNSSDSLVSSRNIVLNGAVTVQQTSATDANKKLDSETAGLLISGYDITTWAPLASNSEYGVSISAQRHISLAGNLSTTANDGVSLSTGNSNGTVQTLFGARITAKQLGLTGDRDKGIFNLATDIGTLQVLGAKALTVDNSVHTGMLLATVVGRVSEATTDPSSGTTVPAVDKPVGAISITTGGDLTIFSLNNQSTQSYNLDGSTNWSFFGVPADPRPLTLIANNIIETPGAFTLDANTHVTLRPYDASRPIVVKKLPGASTDPNTTYYYGGVMGLLNQFNPDVWLTIGGPGYNGTITVGNKVAGNWPDSEQFSLARMSVTFQTTGRVYNMFAADTDLPTMWNLLTSPGTPIPPINCAIGQACLAKISSNEIIIKDSYSGSRYVRIAGQGDGSGGFTPPTSGGGSSGSGDGSGGGSSSSSSSGSDSTSSTEPEGEPGGGGSSGSPGDATTTVVVTTTPDSGDTTIADATDPTTSTTPSDPLGPTDLAPDGGSGSTGSSLAGVDSKTGGESTDTTTDTTGTTLAGDPDTTPPGPGTTGGETGTPGDTGTVDTTTLVSDDTGTGTTGTTLAGDPGGTTPGTGTPGDGSDTTTTAGTSGTGGGDPGTLAGDDGSTSSTGTTLAGDSGSSTSGSALSGDGSTSMADAGGPGGTTGGDSFSGSGSSDGTGTTLAGDPGSATTGSGLAGDGTGASGDGSGSTLAGGAGTDGSGTTLAGDTSGSTSGAGVGGDGSGSSLAGDTGSSGAGTTLAGDGSGGASDGGASGSGTSLAGDSSGASTGTGLAGDGSGSTSLADAGDFAGGGSTSGGGTGDGAGSAGAGDSDLSGAGTGGSGTTLAGDASSSSGTTTGAGEDGSSGTGTALAGGGSTSGGTGDGRSGGGSGSGDGDSLAFGADASGDGDGTSTSGGSATASSGTAFAGADTSGDGGEEGDDRNLTGGTGTVLAGGADGNTAADTASTSSEGANSSGDSTGRSDKKEGGGGSGGSELRFVGGGETDSQAGTPIRIAQADGGTAGAGAIQSPECAADRNQQVHTVSTNPGGGRPLVSVRGNGVKFSSHSCGSGPAGGRSR